MGEQSFPKRTRLRSQQDFDRVYHENHYAADHVLVIQARRNDTNETRLGLSVGKKVGNAVVRNRWKRLIRESFRRQRRKLPAGLDIVVRPRKGAVCRYADVHQSIRKLCFRLQKKLPRSTTTQS